MKIINYFLIIMLAFVFAGCEISVDNTTDEINDIADQINPPDPEPDPEEPPPAPPPNTPDPGVVVPQGEILVNPVISEGEGYDQHVYWKIYNPPHLGRRVSIKWPTDLYTVYGARPENTKCEADGTVFEYYGIDTGDSGKAMKLCYTCKTRYGYEFPRGVIPIMFKDGEPFAAFSVADPSKGIYLRLPSVQQLP